MDIRKPLTKLPALYSQDEKPPEKVKVVKLFNPTGIGTWYLSEFDPETGIAFGLADLGFPELGYVDIGELEAYKGPFGLGIEVDRYWKGTLADAMEKEGIK